MEDRDKGESRHHHSDCDKRPNQHQANAVLSGLMKGGGACCHAPTYRYPTPSAALAMKASEERPIAGLSSDLAEVSGLGNRAEWDSSMAWLIRNFVCNQNMQSGTAVVDQNQPQGAYEIFPLVLHNHSAVRCLCLV